MWDIQKDDFFLTLVICDKFFVAMNSINCYYSAAFRLINFP